MLWQELIQWFNLLPVAVSDITPLLSMHCLCYHRMSVDCAYKPLTNQAAQETAGQFQPSSDDVNVKKGYTRLASTHFIHYACVCLISSAGNLVRSILDYGVCIHVHAAGQ